MKVDFGIKIVNLAGKPIVEDGTEVTLGIVAANALLADNPQTKTAGAEKLKRFTLAQRAYPSGVEDITLEEATQLKEAIAEWCPTLVVGQAWTAIEAAAGAAPLKAVKK